jgi:hypothetical protein
VLFFANTIQQIPVSIKSFIGCVHNSIGRGVGIKATGQCASFSGAMLEVSGGVNSKVA